MHIKELSEDFLVAEETAPLASASEGPFALYRLEKSGWTTPDALALVKRRWRLESKRVSYGGLKDRHAKTTQHFTAYRGPRRNLSQQGVQVTYIGQRNSPFRADDIDGNVFQIVVRNCTDTEVQTSFSAPDATRSYGVPNYFDDQRFGSVGPTLDFVAKRLLLGDYEGALKTALASPYSHDRADAKREKALLRRQWGDWSALRERLPRGHARSLVDYLCSHPTNFRGAAERLRPELRGLYLSAYQSYIWNTMLAAVVRANFPPNDVVDLPGKLGPLPAPTHMNDDHVRKWIDLELPLPNHRIVWPEGDPRKSFFDAALSREGWTQESFRFHGKTTMFFSRGTRRALCLPQDLSLRAEDDERHVGRRKLIVAFQLPRGCYATLVIKRLTRGAPLETDGDGVDAG